MMGAISNPAASSVARRCATRPSFMSEGEILTAARVVYLAVAGLGKTAKAGVDPDGGVIASALAHLAECGADEFGGEVPVGLVRGHGKQQELAHAGGQVLLELGE